MAVNAFDRCIARINEAAGRKLSDDEMDGVVSAIQRAAGKMRAGGEARPETGAGPQVDFIAAKIAEEAAREHVATAERKQRNAALQAVKLGQRAAEIEAAAGTGLSRLNALGRLIANTADGKMNAESIEQRALGVDAALKRSLGAAWDALGHDFLGFVQNKERIRTLIRELRGEDTGDALAKKGAQAWRDTAEAARRMFNDAGGEVGHLDDWGFPQHHSQERVARAGKEAWVNAVLPALDRTRYVDDFGRAWDDARLAAFLGKAWETIATNGYANLEPGQFKGKGATANRHAEARQIHFKSADAYMNYWAHFGEKTFPQILESHIGAMARDIAMLDTFGPNPDATYRTLRDQSLTAQAKATPGKLQAVEREAQRADNLWNVASGKTAPIANRAIAHTFDVLRNLNVAGKLGSAVWASVFGDKVMLEAVSHLNGLPMMQRWYNETRLLNPANVAERNMLRRQGLMLDYLRHAQSRFGEDLGRSSFTGKLANAVMRVSVINAMNEWRRGAFGLSLMDSLGRTVEGTDFAKVDPTEMHLLSSWGINARDWSIWKLAELEDYGHGNDKMLTPDAISRIPDDALVRAGVIAAGSHSKASAQRARQDAIAKLLGAINSESRYAVVEPGWRERAQLYANVSRGTIKGELWRSVLQFKSFPIAQFERMWQLAMSRPTFGGKVGVLSAIMAMQALTGAMLLQTKEMLAGKDPRPMNDWKFGLAAFLQGGALGIYGDFLYSLNQTRYGTGPLEIMIGPTIGPALDLMTSSMNAARAKTEGKDSHLAAHLLVLGKGFVPGNNLWYTKAAVDHVIFQNLQEMLSPGYLANMRARSIREYGQDWWWRPGEGAPSRAPDLSNATK
jgi:hypothetical protein